MPGLCYDGCVVTPLTLGSCFPWASSLYSITAAL